VAAKIQKFSGWDEIWFPSRLWCCKLISIVGRQIVSGLRFQWKLISRMYFEVRNWLVMMKLASTCLNSDMGVVWGLQCLHPNTIKPSYYS
jgi:hypothetical protein